MRYLTASLLVAVASSVLLSSENAAARPFKASPLSNGTLDQLEVVVRNDPVYARQDIAPRAAPAATAAPTAPANAAASAPPGFQLVNTTELQQGMATYLTILTTYLDSTTDITTRACKSLDMVDMGISKAVCQDNDGKHSIMDLATQQVRAQFGLQPQPSSSS